MGYSKSRISKIIIENAVQSQQALLSTTTTSASYALTASYAMNGGGGGGTTTGSFTGSFTGSLLGTASYAITASYAMNGGGSINTSSLVTTSSFNAFTGSYNTGSFTGSFTGSLLGTASYALTASFLSGSVTSASYALTSSYTQVTDKINVINGSSLAAEFYPVIVDDLGNMIPYLDTSFNYTPSTNQLNVGGITSSLFGTSSWAITASHALNVTSPGTPLPPALNVYMYYNFS